LDSFNYRTWCPPDLLLQEIAQDLWLKGLSDVKSRTWEKHIAKAIQSLQGQESDFSRPAPETDKLYMSIGTKDVIEMAHPEAPPGCYDPRINGMPMVHFGPVASGRVAARDEQVRQDISSKF